jgi:hypothetical protein
MLVDTVRPRNSTSLGKEMFTDTSLIISFPARQHGFPAWYVARLEVLRPE